MEYIFYVHPYLDEKKAAEIMTHKRISAQGGTYSFVTPITEYIRSLAHSAKGKERFWGIGISKDMFNRFLFRFPMKYQIVDHKEYMEYVISGCNSMDFASLNLSDNDIIVLAPTDVALRNFVFAYKENGYNKWRWKGISCQWIYSPKASQLLQSEPLFELDESKEHFRSHVIAVPKKEEDIYKYIISEDSNRFKKCNRAKLVDDNESSKLF